MAKDTVTRRDKGRSFIQPTTEHHVIRLQPFRATVLEVDDVHFHHDSPVLLPNYPPEGEATPDNPSLGLAVLARCLLHQRANPTHKVLVVGHADTSGPDQYNVGISKKRANAILHAIMGERAAWVDICHKKHKTEDYQLILKWVASVYGWDCDPGKVDNNHGSKTTKAIKNFQTRYNLEFEASIAEDGVVGKETWGAFFDVYMDMVTNLCETDAEGLKDLQSKMNFLPPKVEGCGENWPIDKPKRPNYRSQINRRVEILFFEPGEEPKLDCHPGGDACVPEVCELYNPKMYKYDHVPVTPSLPRGTQVFLQLFYKDPEGAEQQFPPDFPVTVEYPDGTTQVEKVGAEGKLRFGAKRKDSFILRFETPDVYLATAGPGVADPKPKRTAKEGELKDLHKKLFRFFMVPPKWTIKESDWKVTSKFWKDDPEFRFLIPGRFGATINSSSAPGKMLLDPHWHFLRFEFFDRFYGHSDHNHLRVNIPATLMDGYRSSPAGAKPDTRSHWTINDADVKTSVHALPWIIQFKPDRTAEPKPDKDIQYGFQTEAHTFVISESATSRKIDQITDPAQLEPGVDRLKRYDLPQVWKSQNYFTRWLPDGTGEFFDKASTFEDKIKASNKPDSPLIFSLDDMVLVDGSFNVITLAADEDPAIFSHKFNKPDGAWPDTLSVSGLFEPGADASNAKKYFPYSNVNLPVRSYIHKYPAWTRVIVARSNLFDVFDQRTPDGANRVVGARAAVRWVDATSAGNFVAPTNTMANRPARSDFPAAKPFCSIQPMFEQKHDSTRGQARASGTYQEWATPYNTNLWNVGRYDMVLLRDCDVEDGKEIVVNLHFFRFAMDFTNKPAAVVNADYRKATTENIPARWNGPDPNGQPKVSKFKPADGKALLEGRMCWFVQDVPLNQAHYRINVININRAFMSAVNGTGSYGQNSAASAASNDFDGNVFNGWFTAAHECGHGDSLLDEYNERWGLASYYNRSFGTWIPGDPYDLTDPEPAIMKSNEQVRPHHLWHAAEWVHNVTGVDLQIDTDGSIYKLPHHPWLSAPPGGAAPAGSGGQMRTYVNWPLWADIRVSGAISGTTGARRSFDMYLYPLGKEPYTAVPVAGFDLRGVLLVEVKLYVTFDAPSVTLANIRDTLRDLRRAVFNWFNFKFIANNATVTGAGVDLSPCLIHFTPRFLVPTLPNNIATAGAKNDFANYFNALNIQAGTPPVQVTVPTTEPARTQFLQNALQIQGNTCAGHYGTLVNNTRHWLPEHFQVNVRNTYTTGWTATPGTRMRLRDSATRGPDFINFFGDMLGLDMSPATITAAEMKDRILQRVVKRVLTNATLV